MSNTPPPPGTARPKRPRPQFAETLLEAPTADAAIAPGQEPVFPSSSLPLSPSSSAIGASEISPLTIQRDHALSRVSISIPLADPPDTQVHRLNAWHVDCQFRNDEERKAFRKVQEGLVVLGVRLNDGRPIVSGADAVRWIVQQVAAAIAAEGET